jgi:hypothetical protein
MFRGHTSLTVQQRGALMQARLAGNRGFSTGTRDMLTGAVHSDLAPVHTDLAPVHTDLAPVSMITSSLAEDNL